MRSARELKQDIVFQTTWRGWQFEFHATWGLFSPRAMDKGSRLLLDHLELEPSDTTLDLGCGYGAVGIPIARCCPAGRVHMVDKDFVALEYAGKNAWINGLDNCVIYPSNAFSQVPNVPFDNIVSNIPAHVGAEMLFIILSDALAHLRPRGRLYVVTISHLRKFIRRNLQEVFGNYEKLKQRETYTVAMAERR